MFLVHQRWCNNLNEPLDPFPFLGGCWIKRRPGLRLICLPILGRDSFPPLTFCPWYSHIIVLKRDVKHQLTLVHHSSQAVCMYTACLSVTGSFWTFIRRQHCVRIVNKQWIEWKSRSAQLFIHSPVSIANPVVRGRRVNVAQWRNDWRWLSLSRVGFAVFYCPIRWCRSFSCMLFSQAITVHTAARSTVLKSCCIAVV